MRLRLPHLPRELLLVAAAGCVLVAVFLALVAVDVARSRSAIPADDVRFAAGAPTSGWSPRAVAPFGAGERLLGVRDDVAFRHMLRTLRASKLLDYTVSDPMLAIKRTELAERLESIAVHDPDPVLRSRAMSLLGVVSVVSWNSTPSQGTQQLDRSELLLAAIASFEQAIGLDPENDDAKYNLQLMLQRGQGLLPTEAAAGKNPAAGGKGSRGAGAGAPGSGY
ncbi:MAG TPA: hypothetical protein VEW11_07340 [Gaiellaceae bacterium]|nr:hypothetical protein [Gaiellaceae bacterium]